MEDKNIADLVAFLKSSFQSTDFGKVEEILVARQENAQRKIADLEKQKNELLHSSKLFDTEVEELRENIRCLEEDNRVVKERERRLKVSRGCLSDENKKLVRREVELENEILELKEWCKKLETDLTERVKRMEEVADRLLKQELLNVVEGNHKKPHDKGSSSFKLLSKPFTMKEEKGSLLSESKCGTKVEKLRAPEQNTRSDDIRAGLSSLNLLSKSVDMKKERRSLFSEPQCGPKVRKQTAAEQKGQSPETLASPKPTATGPKCGTRGEKQIAAEQKIRSQETLAGPSSFNLLSKPADVKEEHRSLFSEPECGTMVKNKTAPQQNGRLHEVLATAKPSVTSPTMPECGTMVTNKTAPQQNGRSHEVLATPKPSATSPTMPIDISDSEDEIELIQGHASQIRNNNCASEVAFEIKDKTSNQKGEGNGISNMNSLPSASAHNRKRNVGMVSGDGEDEDDTTPITKFRKKLEDEDAWSGLYKSIERRREAMLS